MYVVASISVTLLSSMIVYCGDVWYHHSSEIVGGLT